MIALSGIAQATGLFVVTNIDDIIVLSLFYAQGAGMPGRTRKILFGQYLGFGAILLAAVTFANGGDNIGVYVPVFLRAGAAGTAVYCAVFLLLVGVLVLAARYVATRPPVARLLERWESPLFPLVLIVLGIVILVEGGAFGL